MVLVKCIEFAIQFKSQTTYMVAFFSAAENFIQQAMKDDVASLRNAMELRGAQQTLGGYSLIDMQEQVSREMA